MRSDCAVSKHDVAVCRYCAPELKAQGHFDEKVDIYSLGIIINDIISGCKLPVQDLPHLGRAEVDGVNADEIRSIISDCINAQPTQRPTAAQVKVGIKRLKQYVETQSHAKVSNALIVSYTTHDQSVIRVCSTYRRSMSREPHPIKH